MTQQKEGTMDISHHFNFARTKRDYSYSTHGGWFVGRSGLRVKVLVTIRKGGQEKGEWVR